MSFFQNFVCALITFIAYCKLDYYKFYHIVVAIHAYFSEKTYLKAKVLMVTRYGIPIGTLMCSKDNGWLPTDIAFAAEMQQLRLQYGARIGYFGKFAVIPQLQGNQVCKQLLVQAVTEWSFEAKVDVAVMMVNPKDVDRYIKFGAKELAFAGKTAGMEKAPAVLMVLDYTNSPRIKTLRAMYAESHKVELS